MREIRKGNQAPSGEVGDSGPEGTEPNIWHREVEGGGELRVRMQRACFS
jgi:hypothetical protein